MERVVSPEERMRRAEEIYYRKRNQGVRVNTSSVSIGNSNKTSLGKKMVIQLIASVLIYAMFWALTNYKNVFSDSVINTTKMVLSYDINFTQLYNHGREYFSNNFNSIIKVNGNSNVENGEQNSQGDDENAENTEENTTDKTNNADAEQNDVNDTSDNIGTDIGNENNKIDDTNEKNEADQTNGNNENEVESNQSTNIENDGTIKAKMDNENKTQMELDAEYIKQNYSLIKPVEGRITSGFGEREQTEIISAFHQGIDIGAPTGTIIHAAMEGTVVASSYAGDYGNHIKIQNGEVLTVYAHCSELHANVGDHVTQGQDIGKVGATGKVTGPHLHFEFRRDGRYVNPELIMAF